MKTFSRLLTFCEGIHRSPVDSPQKGQRRGALVFLWSAPEQTVEHTIETLVNWYAITIIMTPLWYYVFFRKKPTMFISKNKLSLRITFLCLFWNFPLSICYRNIQKFCCKTFYFLHRETVQLSQETYLFYNRMQRFLPHERVMKWKRVPHYWTFVRSPMDSLTKVQ